MAFLWLINGGVILTTCDLRPSWNGPSKQAGPLRSHSGISLDGLALVRQGRVDVAGGGKLGSYAAELQGA